MRRPLVLVLFLGGLAGHPGCLCEHPEESNAPQESLRIPITLDGDKTLVVDEALLASTEPDYRDSGRRAWRLSSLLGDKYDPSLAVEVEGTDGQRHLVARPGQVQNDQTVVLAVNKTGDVRVALVTQADPFPPFHGRGGNRGRGGDPTRVREVKRILLSSAAALPEASPSFHLEVVVEGADSQVWGKDEFAKIEPVELAAEDGDGDRRAWPLRTLVKTLAGDELVVRAVQGEGGRSIELSAERYGDEAQIPVLRVNREGLLKFMWLDGERRPTGGEELRGVRGVRLGRKN